MTGRGAVCVGEQRDGPGARLDLKGEEDAGRKRRRRGLKPSLLYDRDWQGETGVTRPHPLRLAWERVWVGCGCQLLPSLPPANEQ